MRIEKSVTSVTWIPSEAIEGMPKLPFELGITHYDEPPPDRLAPGQLEELRDGQRLDAGLGQVPLAAGLELVHPLLDTERADLHGLLQGARGEASDGLEALGHREVRASRGAPVLALLAWPPGS